MNSNVKVKGGPGWKPGDYYEFNINFQNAYVPQPNHHLVSEELDKMVYMKLHARRAELL